MIGLPAPGGKLHPAGRGLSPLRLAVLAPAALALAAGQAEASGSASVTRVFYDPPSGPLPGCVAPLPAAGGSASASYDDPGGAYSSRWEWTVPQTISAGATGRITASIQVNTAGGAGAAAALKPPFEFGANAGARQQVVAQVPVGAPGSATDEESYTFTPTRDFTDGEKLYIRLEAGCVTVIYEYTGAAAPAAPPKPATRLVPPTTRPVPGVVTSYAAPRPGGVLALPFPASGCAPPAATTALGTAAPAGGECSVDIFLRRKGDKPIHDPAADYGTQLELSGANLGRAYKLCLAYGIDATPTQLGIDAAPFRPFYTCVLTVARILQRAEDLRRRREGTPNELVPDVAHSCATKRVRLRGVRNRRVPLRVLCRHTAAGTRLTFRPTGTGASIGALVRPTSSLIVGRSSAAPFRAGDRVDVLWSITPPPPRTTILVPAPLPGATAVLAAPASGARAVP